MSVNWQVNKAGFVPEAVAPMERAEQLYRQLDPDRNTNEWTITSTHSAGANHYGTHLGEGGVTAAFDLRVPGDDDRRRDMLSALWAEGFAAWFRLEPLHIHGVYVGAQGLIQKQRYQAAQFVLGRGGVVSLDPDANFGSQTMGNQLPPDTAEQPGGGQNEPQDFRQRPVYELLGGIPPWARAIVKRLYYTHRTAKPDDLRTWALAGEAFAQLEARLRARRGYWEVSTAATQQSIRHELQPFVDQLCQAFAGDIGQVEELLTEIVHNALGNAVYPDELLESGPLLNQTRETHLQSSCDWYAVLRERQQPAATPATAKANQAAMARALGKVHSLLELLLKDGVPADDLRKMVRKAVAIRRDPEATTAELLAGTPVAEDSPHTGVSTAPASPGGPGLQGDGLRASPVLLTRSMGTFARYAEDREAVARPASIAGMTAAVRGLLQAPASVAPTPEAGLGTNGQPLPQAQTFAEKLWQHHAVIDRMVAEHLRWRSLRPWD